nr:hypothetical protein GCM10017611_32740 [Rhodococcus wratislaviensis]
MVRQVGAGTYANQLRPRRSQPGDAWHLDEVFIRINGSRHYLWRAVDQRGNVLDVLIQSRRNGNAVKRFFRKLLKGLQDMPRVIIPGSHRPGTRNDSCPPSRASHRISGPADTGSQHSNGVPRWPTGSWSGRKSPRSTPPPESERPGSVP